MSGRIIAVDVMRGLTMAAMIVVNNPGSWAHMAPGLRHAAWGGWPTPADLVFPFFLFLVGVSTPLALRRRLAASGGPSRGDLLATAARRALALAAIGFFLNLFPAFDLASVRVPGVLQRIALVSLACAAAALWLRPRTIAALAAALLAGYTLLLLLVPVPGIGQPTLTPDAHLPAWLDDRVFGRHTWRGPGDPEGLLSSLGAVASGLLGVLAAGVLLAGRSVRVMLVWGVLLLAAGAAATVVVPVAKEVWTASYALVTGGAALLTLGALHLALARDQERQPGKVLRALMVFGRQALPAYVLAHLLSDLSIHVVRWTTADGSRSLHTVVHGDLLASWLPDAAASLAYSLLMLAAVWAAVSWVDRRGWRLRI
jgi:predicted acyltransferase